MPPDLHLHATTCLTLLGLRVTAALRERDGGWTVHDHDTGRTLGTLRGDRLTVPASALLPEEEACVTPLLGPALATRFLAKYPAATADWALCVDGPHEVSLRAGDDSLIASGNVFEPTTGVVFAGVNTWNAALHDLLPAPVQVGPGSNDCTARLLDEREVHVTPSIPDADHLTVYLSRHALDATGHDHPYPHGCWYDPGRAPTRSVLLLAHAFTLESGETFPHGRAPYI